MNIEIDIEILQEFLVEAGELHEQLNDQLADLKSNPHDTELLNAIFRAFHTIKGGAGFMKLMPMVEVCHRAEDLFNLLRQGDLTADDDLVDAFFQVLDVLDDMFKAIPEHEELKPAEPELISKLDGYLNGDAKQEQESTNATEEPAPVSVETVADTTQAVSGMDQEFEQMRQTAQNSGSGESPKSDLITDDEFDSLLDEIHGEGKHGGLSKSANEEASSVQSTQQAAKKPSDDITDEEFDSLMDELHGKNKGPGTKKDDVAAQPVVKESAPEKEAEPKANDKVKETPKKTLVQKDSVRVDTERLDDIMNLVGELVLVRNRLSTLKDTIEHEQVTDAISSLDFVTSQLQSSVMKTRMQPIKKVFSRFPRVIRDLAKKLNKDINLVLVGEETDLDKSLVEALADPLIHLVRNSADHGIESPEDRFAAGKDRQGTVTLSAQQEGDQILLVVSDDGKGMDHRVLRDKAVEKGMYTEESVNKLTDKEVFNLIFEPGFSTKTEISDVSGRGVGMDVVKTRINELNGSVEIDSELGEGSVITIHLPLTLAILPTLMVILGDNQFALPLSNVYEAFNLQTDKINKVDGQEVMRVRDKTLPLYYMHPWLVQNSDQEGIDIDYKVIIVQMGSRRFCLVVDQILGQEEIVIKPLGSMLNNTPGFSGATITGDGSIALVLDVPSLMGTYANNGAIH